MNSGIVRIFGALILVVSLLTLSGLSATAASFAKEAPQAACCDTGGDADHPDGARHSSSLDCPCFACITMILHAPVTVARPAIDGLDLPHPTPKRHCPSAFVRRIDYPPEAA